MPRSKGSSNNAEGNKESSKPKRKPSNSAGHDCTICRKSNMTLSGLKIHLLTHTGEKPFLCTECDKRFTCSSNLKKHQRIHSRDYIYKCDVCGKTCSDPSNMKKHMTVHSDEKAYTCPSCGKSYSYAQSLRQHMDDVHVGNGERRRRNKKKGHFPCPECGKVFGYYWRCSLHQARIHAVDKPYKCPECGKAFARETILNKHIQTHEKPFPCTVCERRFSFRDQLRKHMRTHTGEKPYTCGQCFRSFTQRGSLTEHMRTHTGEKPFGCTNCGQKFSSSSSLKRHQRRVNSCLSLNLGDEIPVDNSPRRVIYIGREPLNLVGLTSPSSPITEEEVSGNLTTVFPVEDNVTNGMEHFETAGPTMNGGPITIVPNFQPIQNGFITTSRSDGYKTQFTHGERISMVNSRYPPHHLLPEVPGLLQIVQSPHEHSYMVENAPVSMETREYRPLAYTSEPSIGMEARSGQQALPTMCSETSVFTDDVDVKPQINADGTIATTACVKDTKPNVTLTTEGIKPLVPSVDNTIPYSIYQPLVATTFPDHTTPKDLCPVFSDNVPGQKGMQVARRPAIRYHSVIVNANLERLSQKESAFIKNGQNGAVKEPTYLIPILNG